MDFRTRLIRTLEAAEALLKVPGVIVIGSVVPNLLQAEGAPALVISEDVDLGVPISRHHELREALDRLQDFEASSTEPSVWLPRREELIEVNLVGMVTSQEKISDVWILEDPDLPLLVFGTLSLLQPGRIVEIENLRVPLAEPAGLFLEKLLTERSQHKGARDLLVAAALMQVMSNEDWKFVEAHYLCLPKDLAHHIRSNLSILSLMEGVKGMPDPAQQRTMIAELLSRLEELETERQ